MNINNLVDYLKTGNNSVLVFNKETGKHYKKTIYRHYISLGEVPEFDSAHPKSYMFHGGEGIKFIGELPIELQAGINKIKDLDSRYNQFVINLYENGTEYIEPHSDCDKDMVEDYKIAILSFGELRIMRLTSRDTKEVVKLIDMRHGEIVLMDATTNKTTRHEILRSETRHPRISITGRMMTIKNKICL